MFYAILFCVGLIVIAGICQGTITVPPAVWIVLLVLVGLCVGSVILDIIRLFIRKIKEDRPINELRKKGFHVCAFEQNMAVFYREDDPAQRKGLVSRQGKVLVHPTYTEIRYKKVDGGLWEAQENSWSPIITFDANGKQMTSSEVHQAVKRHEQQEQQRKIEEWRHREREEEERDEVRYQHLKQEIRQLDEAEERRHEQVMQKISDVEEEALALMTMKPDGGILDVLGLELAVRARRTELEDEDEQGHSEYLKRREELEEKLRDKEELRQHKANDKMQESWNAQHYWDN